MIAIDVYLFVWICMFMLTVGCFALAFTRQEPMAFVAAIVFLMIGVLTLAISNEKSPSTASEITDKYSLPAELAGCRVFRLKPTGMWQVLYVVTRNGQPEATVWSESRGKSKHTQVVQTPELNTVDGLQQVETFEGEQKR